MVYFNSIFTPNFKVKKIGYRLSSIKSGKGKFKVLFEILNLILCGKKIRTITSVSLGYEKIKNAHSSLLFIFKNRLLISSFFQAFASVLKYGF